jgi:hypothetical protein
LKIHLDGPKIGLWKDFSSGDGGSNLLDLLCKVRGGDFRSACEEAANWLSDPQRYGVRLYNSTDAAGWQWSANRQREAAGVAGWQKRSVPPEAHDFRELENGTPRDRMTLAHVFGVSADGVNLACADGALKFFNHAANGRCWSVVGGYNYVRQARRLDGKPFILKDGKGVKARTIGSPRWPVGVPTDKDLIVLAEGSSDFLAAYCIILTEGLERRAAPVAILGAANAICDEALDHFRGKFVLLFPDYDRAGIRAAARWEQQLKDIAAEFRVFDYTNLLRDDGQPVKDLRDFLRIDVDQWETLPGTRFPIDDFALTLSELERSQPRGGHTI